MSNKITDEYLRCKIKKLRKSAEKHRRDFRPGKRRFGLYDYLTDVYAIFLELQSNHVAKKAARRIAKLLELSIRRRAHPIRILIEASAGPEDPRQKSRWTQALRYVLGWRVGPEKVKTYLQSGGISGCAKKQALNTGTSRRKALPATSNSGDPARA